MTSIAQSLFLIRMDVKFVGQNAVRYSYSEYLSIFTLVLILYYSSVVWLASLNSVLSSSPRLIIELGETV